jgi:hypothetical protein
MPHRITTARWLSLVAIAAWQMLLPCAGCAHSAGGGAGGGGGSSSAAGGAQPGQVEGEPQTHERDAQAAAKVVARMVELVAALSDPSAQLSELVRQERPTAPPLSAGGAAPAAASGPIAGDLRCPQLSVTAFGNLYTVRLRFDDCTPAGTAPA